MGIIKDARVLIDHFDVSGDSNALALESGAEDQDDTRFNGDTRIMADDTLLTFAWNLEGFWRAGSSGPDAVFYSRRGSSDAITTIAPSTGAVGDVAFMYKGLANGYNHGGSVGDNHPYNASGGTLNDVVRGQILHGDTVTASGQGTAVNVGAAGASETLYATLHVVSAQGTTASLTVTVQSDSSTSFASPSTQISFSLTNGVVSAWGSKAGAIADTHYRANHVVAGSTASFKYWLSVGVL